LKRAREAAADRGDHEQSLRMTFREYATEWVGRYHGRGRQGFRETTRDDYRRDLERYAFRFFADEPLVKITPRRLSQYASWLCEQPAPGGGELADATVRRILSPVRACMGTAVGEGLIRSNPAIGLALPHRPRIEADEEDVKALTAEQLHAFLLVVPSRHRSLFELLATTGLRISEALALQWQHVALDGDSPHVKVRRAFVRGSYGPPKSRYGRRDVPIPFGLVRALRTTRAASDWPQADDLVFPALNGQPIDQQNMRRRVLKPAAEEAGVGWMGFHTLRHTCASMLFERGANAVQVQRWLGHHSAAFTLSTYVHLLRDDLGEPLELGVLGGNRVATHATGLSRNPKAVPGAEAWNLQELS
jgi:integrase